MRQLPPDDLEPRARKLCVGRAAAIGLKVFVGLVIIAIGGTSLLLG